MVNKQSEIFKNYIDQVDVDYFLYKELLNVIHTFYIRYEDIGINVDHTTSRVLERLFKEFISR